ncbi:organomercurial lyase [Halegenticoccus soli]|uniref:organomercurial lyase n=1 Tax=Halegenticoccus soli TaxID=1985678 RepID=UPI000C6D3587|nr:organomercurial lyase [Halegenticoccus soli]
MVNSNRETRFADRTDLPSDLAEAFRRAGSLDERPESLEAGHSAVTDRLNEAGVTITPEDMYQPEPTRHAVHIDGTVKYVPCVMDALIVALLHEDDTVEIYSESPEAGVTIRFRVTEDGVTVVPTSAVISFGLGIKESTNPDFDSVKDTLNAPDAPIPTTCAVTNAFPDSASFERWAAEISEAALVELSVEKAFSLSKQAARTHVGK